MLIFITITSFSWNNLLEDIKWIKSSKSYFLILSLWRNEFFSKFQLRQLSMGKIHHVLEFYPIISNKQDFIQEKRFWWFFKCPDGWLIFMNVSSHDLATFWGFSHKMLILQHSLDFQEQVLKKSKNLVGKQKIYDRFTALIPYSHTQYSHKKTT